MWSKWVNYWYFQRNIRDSSKDTDQISKSAMIRGLFLMINWVNYWDPSKVYRRFSRKAPRERNKEQNRCLFFWSKWANYWYSPKKIRDSPKEHRSNFTTVNDQRPFFDDKVSKLLRFCKGISKFSRKVPRERNKEQIRCFLLWSNWVYYWYFQRNIRDSSKDTDQISKSAMTRGLSWW